MTKGRETIQPRCIRGNHRSDLPNAVIDPGFTGEAQRFTKHSSNDLDDMMSLLHNPEDKWLTPVRTERPVVKATCW